jgi:hypothetical protein
LFDLLLAKGHDGVTIFGVLRKRLADGAGNADGGGVRSPPDSDELDDDVESENDGDDDDVDESFSE